MNWYSERPGAGGNGMGRDGRIMKGLGGLAVVDRLDAEGGGNP